MPPGIGYPSGKQPKKKGSKLKDNMAKSMSKKPC